MNPFWFLDFAPPAKRFSYAASFGMDALPEDKKAWYQDKLRTFSNISVREPSGQNIVEELIGTKPVLCPDPVFLPTVDLWDHLKAPCETAVVAYMIEFDEVLYRAAQAHAQQAGLPLVYITNVNITPNSLKRTFCTPEEWLGYFRQAHAVYTNSFHGISFSCLFHKPLYYRGLQRLAKRNNRIDHLLHTLDAAVQECPEKQYYAVTFPDGWAAADQKIHGLRTTGLAYLDQICTLTENPTD